MGLLGDIGETIWKEGVVQPGESVGQFLDELGGAKKPQDKVVQGGIGRWNKTDPVSPATPAIPDRTAALDSYQTAEQDFQQRMLGMGQETSKAIDKQLAALINQTGFVTGLQKQAIAGQQSDRGMLRSGQTSQQLQGAELQKQSTIGQLRAQSEQQKYNVGLATAEAQKEVSAKKEQLANRLVDLEIQGLSGLKFQEEATRLDQEYKMMLDRLATSAANKQALMGIFGGAAQAAGTYAGYKYGKSDTPAPSTATDSTGSK